MSGTRTMVLLAGLVFGACKAERAVEIEESEPTPPPGAKQPEPEKVAESDEPPSAAQLPVAEDFQVETAAAIVRANYRSELEALEGELRADGE